MELPTTLIGPSGAGKTITSHILKEYVGIKHICADKKLDKFLDNLPDSEKERNQELINKATLKAYNNTLKRNPDISELEKDLVKMTFGIKYTLFFGEEYRLDVLKQLFEENNGNYILDTGSTLLCYQKEENFVAANKILENYNKILLLPTDDEEKNSEILYNRREEIKRKDRVTICISNSICMQDGGYLKYTPNHIIYNHNLSPLQTATEVAKKIVLTNNKK